MFTGKGVRKVLDREKAWLKWRFEIRAGLSSSGANGRRRDWSGKKQDNRTLGKLTNKNERTFKLLRLGMEEGVLLNLYKNKKAYKVILEMIIC